MMVGILAYMLPPIPQGEALIPAIGGVIMALGGWITMHKDSLRKHLMHINALIALLLFIWTAIRTPGDWANYWTHSVYFLADVDVMVLTAVFLYYAIKSFKEARKKR